MKKLGRSTTQDPDRTVWRVTTVVWGIKGPFCFSCCDATGAGSFALGFQLYNHLVGNIFKTLRSYHYSRGGPK